MIRASGAASIEETQWLTPRKPRGEPCMCLPTHTLLVNCHKQETQLFWRLSGLGGIWEINLPCWGRAGTPGCGNPKSVAVARAAAKVFRLALQEGSQRY